MQIWPGLGAHFGSTAVSAAPLHLRAAGLLTTVPDVMLIVGSNTPGPTSIFFSALEVPLTALQSRLTTGYWNPLSGCRR